MEYKFLLEQSANVIRISKQFWSGHLSVSINGRKVSSNIEGNYIIQCLDNTSKVLIIKRRLWGLDPVPTVFIEGKEINIARKLNPIEYLISCLPLLLLFRGAVGGFFGLIITWFNLLLQRSSHGFIVRYTLILIISLLGLVGYMIITQFLNLGLTIALHHLHG